MRRTLLAFAVALVALLAACSGGGSTTTPTTLPPTTQALTPVFPTGVADAARRWVSALDQDLDDVAFDAIAPRSQAAMGGRAGLAGAKATLDREWGVWGRTAGTVFDALPVSDGVAVVVVRVTDAQGQLAKTAALPMRVVGGRWRTEPLLSTGTYKATPPDRSKVIATPTLRVRVEPGVTVGAYVDSQPARLGKRDGEVTYRPATGLRPGWHVAALVFVRGDDVTARALRYRVPD